jgi:dTDP-glucose pyrophosphorylase
MPMGGLGSRFSAAGYTTPKALIEVDGKPMFMRALDSFVSVHEVNYIFVIRQEHDNQYNLATKIKAQLPDSKIAILSHDTGGAVETCMIAKDLIDDDLPISVADCDIYFESAEYFEKATSANKPDGMLLTFNSDDPRYSYAELDEAGSVIRTAEKIVISNHAILGGYFFKSGSLFKNVATEFTNSPLPEGIKEYYMSHLFNLLLQHKAKIEIAKTDTMHIFGTPDELSAYLKDRHDEQ